MPMKYIEANCNQQQQGCESRVIDPVTLGECSNEYYDPYGRPGPIVVKVPVVLSEVKVQIDLETGIRLEEPAFDIKTIDKHVCITQCHLVPYTNKLFIGGYVQKNIQYSTVECTNATSISGNIMHTTLNVPFTCVTPICFAKSPKFGKSFKMQSNVLDETMLCEDTGENSWIHFDKPYEPIFCELEGEKILETDIYERDINCGGNFTTENCFQNFTEKMVVYLRIKVLQNQQVFIPEPECEVEMEEECRYDKKCRCDKDDDYEEVEVCYRPKKGMRGRRVRKEEY